MTDQDATPAERQPSAIDITVRELARNARYFAAVAAGNGADKDSPEFKSYRDGILATTIGAAIGLGKLYRKSEPAADTTPGAQIKTLERDARWLAGAAGDNLGMDKESDAYKAFTEKVLDTALATALAQGRFKAPSRSFASKVEESRSEPGGQLGV